MEFYWSTATAIPRLIFYSCFCATTLHLNSCDRDDVARSAANISYLVLYRESLPSPKAEHNYLRCLFDEMLSNEQNGDIHRLRVSVTIKCICMCYLIQFVLINCHKSEWSEVHR